ncbi:MAG: TolC family outer membrane protein [Geminicoccaceae bacterium]|nr:TolC family outer membrane protein [Geminicoccaceae bacterium]
MSRVVLVLSLLAVVLPGPVWRAAEAAGVPLAMALAKAYLENPRLQAARAELRAADEGVPLALSGYRPRLTARSSFDVARIETAEGGDTVATSRSSLALEQPIYTGGRSSAEVNRAELRVRAERARLEAIEQEVLLEAVGAYTAVLRDQRLLELALEAESRLLNRLQGIRDRFRFGELTRTDVARAEARYAAAVAEAAGAAGDLRRSGAAYRTVIGDPPGALLPPDPPAGLPIDADDAALATDAHPAVRAAAYTLDVATETIEAANAALRPQLTLQGAASYVDEPETDIATRRDLRIGALLTVPLYQGGGTYARIRQTRQERAARRHDLIGVRRTVVERQIAALETRESAAERIEALEMRLEAARLALDGLRAEAAEGVRTVADLLDGEEDLHAAERALVTTRREHLLASFTLAAATGGLTAAALGIDAELYDPERYYGEVRGRWFGTGEDGDEAEDGARAEEDTGDAIDEEVRQRR